MVGNCCDFDGGICGRGTDCHGAARLAMTARRRRADGTSGTPSPTKRHGARACGRTESSAPTSCHSEPVRRLAWESVSPRLPLRGRCQREALTAGEMPRVFLSPSRLRRQPPPRGGLTARRCRADGTSRTPPPTKRHGARACGRTESSAPLQREKRRLPPSLFIQLYCRTTAVTLPSRVA